MNSQTRNPRPETRNPISLPSLTLNQLITLLTEAGFERYRARQVYEWVHSRGAKRFDDMSNLPGRLRGWLAEHTRLNPLELVRVSGQAGQTQKALFRLDDGRLIESVVMRDDENGRVSFCLSSQVGCALACTFCLTGFGGFQRDLTPGEIVAQALVMRRELLAPAESLHHIVFMGMGEPMLNMDGVIAAVRLLTDPLGFGLSPRRITVSTAGVVPGIDGFGAANLKVGLAVSLNATTDAARSSIMPINRRWPIRELMDALGRYPLEPRRRLTIEYVLLKGINDTPEDAKRLVDLLGGLRCKVNLIMFNPCRDLPCQPVQPRTLDAFAQVLSSAHMTVTVRWSKGREIEAACGQLAAHALEPADA